MSFHAVDFVSGNLHPDYLRDAGPAHVPHRGAPQIMEVQIWHAGGFAGSLPSQTKIPYSFPAPVEYPLRIKLTLPFVRPMVGVQGAQTEHYLWPT